MCKFPASFPSDFSVVSTWQEVVLPNDPGIQLMMATKTAGIAVAKRRGRALQPHWLLMKISVSCPNCCRKLKNTCI